LTVNGLNKPRRAVTSPTSRVCKPEVAGSIPARSILISRAFFERPIIEDTSVPRLNKNTTPDELDLLRRGNDYKLASDEAIEIALDTFVVYPSRGLLAMQCAQTFLRRCRWVLRVR
jgi:hypothetical protein